VGVTLYYKDATNLIILGKVFGYRDREMPRPHGKILNPTVMQSCYKITEAQNMFLSQALTQHPT
jgi:hypothetical protein